VTPGSSRLLRIGSGVGGLAVLVGTILLLWPREWPNNLMTRPSEGEHLFGETVGWVSKVEASTNTIHVSSRPLGVGAVPLLVTQDTKVVVGPEKGAFGDLHEGTHVRVAYELREGTSLARSVEILVEGETGRATHDEPRAMGAASTPADIGGGQVPDLGPPAAAKPAEPAAALRPAETSKQVLPSQRTPAAASQPETQRAATRPTPPRAQAEIPAPLRTSAPAPGRSRATTPAPARSEGSTSSREPARPQEPTRSQDEARSQNAEAPDPSAIIDWLLKEGRR
jgi:hypothetical protein